MAKSKTSEQARGIYPARADAIRIVPLYQLAPQDSQPSMPPLSLRPRRDSPIATGRF